MNSILRIHVPSTLNVAAQHTDISKQPHFMIRSIILSGLRVQVNIGCEIYYLFDSRYEKNKSYIGPVQYVLTLKIYQHIN